MGMGHIVSQGLLGGRFVLKRHVIEWKVKKHSRSIPEKITVENLGKVVIRRLAGGLFRKKRPVYSIRKHQQTRFYQTTPRETRGTLPYTFGQALIPTVNN